MAITRIKNNQITDATIVASSKLVDYSITSTKIANNLTYGSDLTITGNLTVNGTATTIDTINLVIEDPLILLSKNATGSPTADIGFIGERGDSTNIAFVWDESGSEFITAFTSSTETNTNITVSSYANFRTFDAAIGGNLAVTGTTAITGNVSVGNVIATGLVQGETVTATGNLSGGNANITNAVNSATLSVTGNANVGNLGTAGLITATGNITGGNLNTAGQVVATGNVNGGNLNVQSGGVFADTGYFTGNVDVLGNLNATVGVVYANSGIFLGDAVTGNNAAFAGIPGFTQLGSNVVMQFAGNVNSYSQLNFQNINNGTAASTDYIATADNGDDSNYYVNMGINSSTFNDPTYAGFFPNDSYLHNHGGNLILNPETTGKQIVMMVGGTATANVVATVDAAGLDVTGTITATGNITGGNLTTTGLTSTATLSASGNANVGNLGTAGLIVATGNITGGNLVTAGQVDATGNITGGNLNTAGLTSTATLTASGNANVGNLGTAGQVTATGNITGGNIITAGLVTATGNITGGNLTTAGLTSTATLTASGNANVGNLGTTGLIVATGNITGGNLTTAGLTSTATLSASGNANVGNLGTAALVATGAITGSTTLSITGNANVGNLGTAGLIVATGNVTGGNLVTTGVTKTGTLETSGDALVAGNLVVQGNLTYINIDDLRVEDPVIVLGTGPNGAPLTTDDGKDRGVFMEYYTTGIGNAFVGWDNSTGNMIISSDVSIANDVITVNSYGTLEAGNIYVESASISQTFTVTGNANVGNLGTTGLIVATGNITGGNLVTAGVTQSGTLSVTGNANVGNLGTAGLITATGNITGGNLVTAGVTQSGTLSVTGNANVGNLGTAALVATGAITGSTTLDITGNANVGNLGTAGLIVATGNITGGNLNTAGLTSTATLTASGNANVGNLGTAGLIVATGNITGGNLVTAGVTQSGTLSVTGNANVGNLGTAALVATGAITGSTTLDITGNANVGNLGTAGLIVATGNITGGNLVTAGVTQSGTLSVTGNANVGNLGTAALVATGAITGSTTLDITGNANVGNLGTAGLITATGNITGGNLVTAGVTQSGTLSVTGNANVGNLGTAALVATGAITGSTTLSITGNANVGNLGTAGLIVATGNITGGNLTTAGLTSTATLSASGNANVGNLGTAGLIVATGNIDGGNLNTAGQVVATGNITGGNITTAGRANLGNIVISGDEITGTNGRVNINEDQNDVDFSVSGLAANVFYVDAAANSVSIGNSTQTTGAVLSINSTGSMLLPVGTTGERPGTGVTGMIRFNTTSNQLEYYDSDDWTVAGTTFTVIASEQFSGDGSTVAFTLSTSQTTASCIVSINGVVQIPTTAYSVSGTTLTFTEAPLSGDAIEVRQITTTSTITGVSNTPGTAIVQPNVTLGDIDITGNIVPIANATQNLGSASKYWKDLYLSGSTIYLGPLQLKAADANTFAVYKSDGTTQANLDVGAIDVSAIVSGTSSIGISGTGGNAYITVGGTANVLVASTTGANITGALGVTGNITGAYILGNGSQLTGIDATSIQNGTSNVRTVLNGNVTVSAAGTANVLVVTSTGANVNGTLDVTGNITSGNVSGTNISGTLLTAAQPNITSVGTLTSLAVAGNISPGGIAMSTGNATIGNLYVSGTTTIAGNIQQISGNSGQFFGNADTGFNALYAGLPAGFSILPQSVVNFVSEFNGYSQINNQNQSNGNEATVDWVLTGDNGNDSTYFLDIGFTGSGYDPAVAVLNNALGDVVTPGDAYIYTTGNVAGGDPSHLVMGTVDAGSYVRIFVGGPTAGNVAAQFNAPSQANTVTVSGGITVTGTASISAINNGGGNGVGNIGSATGYFNTVFAKATSAQYADLAEVYESDADYEPGTVLVFGGDREVTIADQANDTRIAGVVSTNPSYLMNSAMTAQHTVAVALTGRVPTKVTGTVRKGDLMVSAGNGVATANNQACLGSVIGKALENFDGNLGVIEIVVGRL